MGVVGMITPPFTMASISAMLLSCIVLVLNAIILEQYLPPRVSIAQDNEYVAARVQIPHQEVFSDRTSRL